MKGLAVNALLIAICLDNVNDVCSNWDCHTGSYSFSSFFVISSSKYLALVSTSDFGTR